MINKRVQKNDLENRLTPEVRKLHEIFKEPHYLNLIRSNSTAYVTVQLCNNRQFFELARLNYSDQDALSLVAHAVKTFKN